MPAVLFRKIFRDATVFLLILSTIAGLVNYYYNGQKPAPEAALSTGNKGVLMSAFTPAETGESPLKRIINNKNPLNLVNYYGNEPVTDLWRSIPDNQKPYSVILIIPGHTLLPGCSARFLEDTADICEANTIPYAIQNLNGEIHNEEKLPVAYLENRFAQRHRYFYGLNCAELYNGVTWRGETESNNSQYIIDCINLVVKYGAFFFWTDTNMNYDSGMVLEWFETNEAFYSAFKNNAENIVLMNKESYGTASTYSVMQGLWLAGLIGNWGVASDWWHWQVDGDKKSLFGEFDKDVDDEWDLILSYPENMYVQSMMLVMSCGGCCFKAEAPNFSTSAGGVPIAGFEYGISPLLNAVINDEIDIPSKEEVLADTPAAVLGKANYPEFNYNYSESNLYPCTGRYRIIPLLPANLRLAERAVFETNGIVLVEKELCREYYDKLYKEEARGDTYAVRTGAQWVFIHNVENAQAVKSAEMKPVLCSATSFSIQAAEHTSAVIAEKSGGLGFYLSNYRTDKSAMVKAVTPAVRAQKSWVELCMEFMVIDENGNPKGLDDTVRRTTVVTVKGTLNGGEPGIVWRSDPGGSGPQNRPFDCGANWNAAEKTLTLTIHHNGPVKFDVLLDESGREYNPPERPPLEPSLKKNGCSTKVISDYIKTLTVKDKSFYNEYSFLKFNAALEKAGVVISEGTYSMYDIYKAKTDLEAAYNNLLDISKYTSLLKEAVATEAGTLPPETQTRLSLAVDALLRETLSNSVYVPGRSNKLEYAKGYKNAQFDKAAKTAALEGKYDDLQSVMDSIS